MSTFDIKDRKNVRPSITIVFVKPVVDVRFQVLYLFLGIFSVCTSSLSFPANPHMRSVFKELAGHWTFVTKSKLNVTVPGYHELEAT